MSAPKYKEWILETIDQLRKRKARPDLDRICHMVERKHGVTFEETEADLERLVDSEIVIKVDYKGSTSYRNALKWRKSHLGGHILNSNDASRKIQSAMLSLTAKEEESCADDKRGASTCDIEKWIESESADTNLSKNHLQVALDREIDAGRLEKLPTGNFIIHNSGNKTMKCKSAHNGSAPAKIGSPSKKGRPATKRKRFKKSHGPDFESFELVKPPKGKEQITPKREETPPPPPELEDDIEEDKKCDYCLLTAASNRNGDPEELLVCKDCQAKAHPSCMQYSEELAKRARTSPWQCIDCKTCYVCDDSGDPDAMLFCDACDKGYHMNCHNPPIQEKPTGKWVCSKCVLELGHKVEEEEEMETDQPVVAKEKKELQQEDPKEPASAESGGPSCLPTPSDSPIQFQNGQEEMPNKCLVAKMNGDLPGGSSSASTGPTITTAMTKCRKFNVDGEIPDASEWSIDDVEQFFEEVGFPEQAYVFREQEIDGKSLLLMKRSDVLTGLSLKLGPALKIYNHVQRLQTGGQPVH